jgi:3',5'-cyclic AMP phosphodiesterase CpdA
MERKGPAQVCWIFTPGDESIARELLDLAAVLEMQGIVKNWSPFDLLPGQDRASETESRVRRADVVMILAGDGKFAPPQALALRAQSEARFVLVAVRPIRLSAESILVLPRDGEPLLARRDRREGLLDVIKGLQELVPLQSVPVVVGTLETQLGALVASGTGTVSAPAMVSGASISGGISSNGEVIVTPQPSVSVPLSIDEIFQLNGAPSLTFIEPPRFDELKHHLRTMGAGLIVEGPSRVGKSTAVKKAMEALRIPEASQLWWDGRTPPSLDVLKEKLQALQEAKENAWLFIDDFHYITEEPYFRAIAFGIKGLADQGPRSHGKVILIGINPLAGSLVHAMPDLAGRYRIHRLDVDRDWKRSTKIAELVIRGEQAANLRFKRRDELVIEANGSFYLAQFLCNKAALASGVMERAATTVEIPLGPADVIASIQEELAAQFRGPLLEFAAFDAAPPPRGAGLSLLWLLSRSPEGFIAVKEARLRFPMLQDAFDWFLESNLSRCFKEHPSLQGLLYYNRSTATLTMEDPQLKFYLRKLDWEKFAEASGHGRVSFHPEDGPIWPRHQVLHAAGSVAVATAGDATWRASSPATTLLHLSDLHFSSKDQVESFYSQLAADLRQQGVDDRLVGRLDALVVSGDLVNRAESTEYDAARYFLEKLMAGFALLPSQVTLVPGNHDVSWTLARSAYSLRERSDHRGPLNPGTYIEVSAEVIRVRDDEAYRRRLQPFADLYKQIKGKEYPLDYADQATFDDPPGTGLLILGLNSAWEIDHHYRDRASIHATSLARALDKLGPPTADQLRIAVFHHPIGGGEDSRIRDSAFLQQLAVHGFRLALHGHVHKADAELYRYDRSEGGRQLELVAAGTFGAPAREWVPGYPLQYNLLLIDSEQITVETRARAEINGAWAPDARWQQGPGKDPLPRYFIKR